MSCNQECRLVSFNTLPIASQSGRDHLSWRHQVFASLTCLRTGVETVCFLPSSSMRPSHEWRAAAASHQQLLRFAGQADAALVGMPLKDPSSPANSIVPPPGAPTQGSPPSNFGSSPSSSGGSSGSPSSSGGSSSGSSSSPSYSPSYSSSPSSSYSPSQSSYSPSSPYSPSNGGYKSYSPSYSSGGSSSGSYSSPSNQASSG